MCRVIGWRVPGAIGIDLQARERTEKLLRDGMGGIFDFALHADNGFGAIRRAEKSEHQFPASGLIVQTRE